MNTFNKRCISASEAARLLGISRGLCYRLLRDGSLPSVRLGRRLVIPVAELDNYLERSAQKVGDLDVKA